MDVGPRPPTLDGCWAEWVETPVDNMIRTDMEAGNVKTRRRFTGKATLIQASVVVKTSLYNDFVTWYDLLMQQGAIATTVRAPYNSDVVVQFMGPPVFQFATNGTMRVSVNMMNGSWF